MYELTDDEINSLINKGNIILLRGKYVYDVTNFDTHPGGSKCLKKRNNMDVSEDYKFHRDTGKKLWKKYCIGVKKKNSTCLIL